MFKLILNSFFFYFLLVFNILADEGFNQWLKKFEMTEIFNTNQSNMVIKILNYLE